MTIDTAALTSNIDREIGLLRVFIDVLRAEQSALMHGDGERIAGFADQKANHVFELTRLGEERTCHLAGGGFSSDRAGMERFLRERADPALRNRWQQLLALTLTAQQTNTTNGMIISTRLHHTQCALNTIFSTASIPGAYGADGNTVSLRTAQQLAVA